MAADRSEKWEKLAESFWTEYWWVSYL